MFMCVCQHFFATISRGSIRVPSKVCLNILQQFNLINFLKISKQFFAIKFFSFKKKMNRDNKEGRRLSTTGPVTSSSVQDSNQGYDPTGANSTSILYSLLCIIAVLAVSFNEPADAKKIHSIQYISLLIVTFAFLYFAYGLNQPTQEEEQEKQQELQQAIPLAGETGVTQEWYDQMGILLNKIATIAVAALVVWLLDSIRISSPLSVWQYMAQNAENAWLYVLSTYSHK
ncbi:hypothetical protein RFI_18116, partial [Reticulomyxa filosa]